MMYMSYILLLVALILSLVENEYKCLVLYYQCTSTPYDAMIPSNDLKPTFYEFTELQGTDMAWIFQIDGPIVKGGI